MTFSRSWWSTLFVLAVPAAHRFVQSQDNVCPDLSQSDAPFYDLEKALKTSTPIFDLVQYVLPTIPAPVNQCLASFEGGTIFSILSSVDASCMSVAPTFDNLPEIKDLVDLVEANPKDKLKTVFEFIYNAPDASYVNLCRPILKPLTPCLRQSLAPVLAFLTARTGANAKCCAGFEDYIQRTFGTSLASGLLSMYTHLTNAVCSYRSPGFDTSASSSQTCGFTFLHALVDSVNANEGLNLLKLLEIPNEEACAAYTGQSFKDTLGKMKLPLNPNPKKSLDSCSEYLDILITSFASLPILSQVMVDTDVPLSALVDSGMCLNWSVLLDALITWAKSTVPPQYKLLLDNLLNGNLQIIELIRGSLGCLHLPSNFTRECAFTTKSTTFLSAPVEPQEEDEAAPKKNSSTPRFINFTLGLLLMSWTLWFV